MHAYLDNALPHARLVHDFLGPKRLLIVSRQIHDHALLYVQRGTGTCTTGQTESGRIQPIQPGCLVLVPPMTVHGLDLADPDRIHMLNIHFDPILRPDSESQTQYLLDPVRPRARGDQFPELAIDRVVVLPLRLPAAYELAFRRAWRRFPATDRPGRLRLRAAMIELLAILISERSPNQLPPPPDPRLETARRILAESPTPVLLETVAAQAGLGRSAFTAAFRAQYGTSPMLWHRRHRIERAKLDLLENQPIKVVAERWGFHSAAHFTRVFTEEVGEPPARWVKQARPPGEARSPG